MCNHNPPTLQTDRETYRQTTCESKKSPRHCSFLTFFHKRLGIFKQFLNSKLRAVKTKLAVHHGYSFIKKLNRQAMARWH